MCKVVFRDGQYYLVYGSTEVQMPVITDKKDGHEYFKLPENSQNRKFANRVGVDKAIEKQGFYDISFREPRTLGERSSSIPKKPDVEWLDDPTDRQTFQTLLDKIADAKKRAKEEAKRPLTEKEKLERMIAKYQAKLDNLKEE